jgi:hypothetical protein
MHGKLGLNYAVILQPCASDPTRGYVKMTKLVSSKLGDFQ